MTIPVSTECALPVTGWSNRRRANSNRSRVIPNALKKLKIDRRQPSNGLRRNSPRPLLEQGRRSAASQAPELRPESQTVQNTLNKEKAEAIFNDPSPSADHASRLVQVD